MGKKLEIFAGPNRASISETSGCEVGRFPMRARPPLLPPREAMLLALDWAMATKLDTVSEWLRRWTRNPRFLRAACPYILGQALVQRIRAERNCTEASRSSGERRAG